MAKRDGKQKETGELEKRIEELENQVKRVLADYQNLEKRVSGERSEWVRGAGRDIILRILPVFDTLILAAKHSQDQTLQISVKQFEDVLKTEGVTKIETVGKEFSPATMECVATESGEDGKVIEEIRVGYMLHDKVLRPAQVKVGKAVL